MLVILTEAEFATPIAKDRLNDMLDAGGHYLVIVQQENCLFRVAASSLHPKRDKGRVIMTKRMLELVDEFTLEDIRAKNNFPSDVPEWSRQHQQEMQLKHIFDDV